MSAGYNFLWAFSLFEIAVCSFPLTAHSFFFFSSRDAIRAFLPIHYWGSCTISSNRENTSFFKLKVKNMKIPEHLGSVSGCRTCKQTPRCEAHVKAMRRRFGIASVIGRLHFTPPAFVPPLSDGLPRQRDCHYDHYRWPFSLCPPSKGLLVLPVAWLPGSSPLARWLLTPGLAHSLAPAPSISLITAMKAVQTGAGIRAN